MENVDTGIPTKSDFIQIARVSAKGPIELHGIPQDPMQEALEEVQNVQTPHVEDDRTVYDEAEEVVRILQSFLGN